MASLGRHTHIYSIILSVHLHLLSSYTFHLPQNITGSCWTPSPWVDIDQWQVNTCTALTPPQKKHIRKLYCEGREEDQEERAGKSTNLGTSWGCFKSPQPRIARNGAQGFRCEAQAKQSKSGHLGDQQKLIVKSKTWQIYLRNKSFHLSLK